MKITGLDDEKCIKCLACIDDCPANLFFKPPTKTGEKRRVFFEDPHDKCIECGHCVAICPTNAITYSDAEDPMEFEEAKNPSTLIEYEALMKVLRCRRSIRKYKEKKVSDEDIEAVLQAMRYAPTARNAQVIKYIVITNPEKIEKFRLAVVKMWKKLLKLLLLAKKIKFLLPKKLKEEVSDSNQMSLEKHVNRSNQGIDEVFYNAPVVIVLHVPPGLSKVMAGNDAGDAITFGMLAAQSRGLGTCWIGYAMETINRSKDIKKWLKIPKENMVTGVFILGHPAVKYHRVPSRKTLIVDWN